MAAERTSAGAPADEWGLLTVRLLGKGGGTGGKLDIEGRSLSGEDERGQSAGNREGIPWLGMAQCIGR